MNRLSPLAAALAGFPNCDAAARARTRLMRSFAHLLLALCFTLFGPVSAQAQATNPRQNLEPDGRSRTFNLYLVNLTAQAQTFTVGQEGWSCCDSPLPLETYGPVPPGGRVTVWIARVQGNGCDGEQGEFWLLPAGYGGHERQEFSFSNDGGIAVANTTTRFAGKLSQKNPADGSYTWTMTTLAQTPRLASPMDERLARPRDRIAADSGQWGNGTTVFQDLRFTPAKGTQGNFYDDCFGKELFHPQHVVRLPNKNGRAYFMLASSRAHNGAIQVLETYPGVLDPETDLLRWTDRTTRIGEYVWMDLYTGKFNGTFNPVGNWNHPGKMDLVGNVLTVAAQNWREGTDFCFWGLGNSEDAVLFYDVQDPRNPVYWGKITAGELGGIIAIDGTALFRDPATDQYELWITGDKTPAGEIPPLDFFKREFRRYRAPFISPRIEDWTYVEDGGDAKQHGGFFSSYQLTPGATYNGENESRMFFGSDTDQDQEFRFTDYSGGPARNFGLALPGADRHWVSESVYVTRQGVPVIYTVESDDHYGSDGILYQVYDTRNANLRTPHPDRLVTNTDDHGPGSLRRAIGYGGKITFAPALSGQTIRLTSGPLIAYVYDVDIDASTLPGGLTLSGNGLSSVFQVERDVKATLRGVTIRDGGNGSDFRFSDVVVNRGTLELLNSTLHDNRGGLRSFAGRVLLQNCTVTKTGLNAVWNAAGSVMTLRHCTVAGNVMAGGSSAVVNLGTLTLENSIVANNQNAVGPVDVAGVYATVGANLIGGDARLAALARNGARVETLEPLPDSPAINAGLASTVATDALGRPRPIGGAADLGAVEAVVVTAVSSSNLDYFSLSGESLSWAVLPGAEFEVFLNPGNGFVSVGRTTGTSLGLPELIANRNYQWRIDVTLGGRTYPGRTQAFTTRGPLVVTTLTDEDDSGLRQGTGDSLRELLKEASPGELIRFAPSLSGRSIWLDRGPLLINQSVTIDAAPLPDRISIDALGKSRVFTVSAGKTVVLKGLRIANGFAPTGAGILNDGGTLTLRDCRLSENESSGNGGGVHNANGGTLKVSDGTVFEQNLAQDGGGIFNAAACALDIDGATFSRNQALGGGGAIHNRGTPFSVKLASFSGNGANIGGAIYDDAGTGVVENCTLARNSSAAGTGGGIASHGASSLTVRHSTIAENVGAGVFNDGSNPVTLDNSIVSGNFDLKNDTSDFLGSYTAVGANLVRVTKGSTQAGGPAPLTSDPKLGNLSSGTMPLLVGSPAIDGGVLSAHTPSTDQDRSLRPFGPAPDLGAVESRLSADVDLLWLTTSAGPYSPVFERNTTNYTVSVPAATMTTAARAAKVRGGQTLEVRINGGAYATVNDRAASPDLPLLPGENQLEVRVTSESGSVFRTYTIHIVRGATSDANSGLASLTTTAGALSPAFDFAVPGYHVSVPNDTASTTVTAVAAKAGSQIGVRANFGLFTPLASGLASAALPLHVGANTIDLQVTGDDGAPAAFYTLTVTRAAPAAANASLAALTTGAGTLSPAYVPGISFYEVTVDGSVSATTLTPTAAQAGATIQVRANGGAFTTVASGATSPALALTPGRNVLEAKVTAQDGTTVHSYTVTVNRRNESIEWASSPGNNNSATPKVSADGRFVAYSSRATDLVPDDTNNQDDIFVFDSVTKAIERVSVSSAGAQGNFASVNPSISADGRYVAFESEATNLVPGDGNGQTDRSAGVDVFVHDRTTHTTERVSLTETGSQVNQASRRPSISGDGRYVAFQSGGNNLIAGFRSGQVNVYVRDRVANTLVGASVPYSVIPSNRSSLNPVLSEDGNYVAFEFTASLNDGNRSFSYRDIYLFNRVTLAVERLTGTKVGLEADRTDSRLPSISGDGRYVAFQSTAEDLDFFDVNGKADVFVYDRITGLTRRVSASPTGVEELFQDSINATISGDGRYVAFQSRIANFVTPDINGSIDVFVKDMVTGEFSLKSSTPAGVQGDGDSTFPSLSADGRSVAFISSANNLAAGKTSFNADVFLVTTAPSTTSPEDALASLTTSLGAQTPGFSPAVSAYSQGASAETEFVQVRPVAADAGTTVSVRVGAGGFSPLESGAVSAELPLATGNNTVEVKTTAANGTTGRTYTLTITRARSSIADLARLSLGSGDVLPLTPAFAAGTKNYAASVPGDAAFVTVSPAAAHPGATVTVNGTAVPAGSSSAAIALNLGANSLTTVVTAEDGTTKSSYVVVVNRAPSSNADLATLLLSVEPISGFFPFNRLQTDYTLTVANETASLALTPTADDATAQIRINGQSVASGGTSGALPLTVGLNPLTVTVTAQDGATAKSYVVNVVRAEPVVPLGSNADLAGLVPNAGSLSPAFAAGTTAYTLSVADTVTSLRLTPTVADPSASVAVNGVAVASGSASAELPLTEGTTAIQVTVIAENGTAVKTYTVSVTRAQSTANISVTQSNGILILVFTGILESATTPAGPFQPVAGATSPFATVTDANARFYRAR